MTISVTETPRTVTYMPLLYQKFHPTPQKCKSVHYICTRRTTYDWLMHTMQWHF